MLCARYGIKLREIAFVLGFGSPEAFQRAFKRWTGVAPGHYRLQKLHLYGVVDFVFVVFEAQ